MQTAIAKSAVFVAAICSRERTGGRRGAASSCRSWHQVNGNDDGTDHATQHIHHTHTYTHNTHTLLRIGIIECICMRLRLKMRLRLWGAMWMPKWRSCSLLMGGGNEWWKEALLVPRNNWGKCMYVSTIAHEGVLVLYDAVVYTVCQWCVVASQSHGLSLAVTVAACVFSWHGSQPSSSWSSGRGSAAPGYQKRRPL